MCKVSKLDLGAVSKYKDRINTGPNFAYVQAYIHTYIHTNM